MPYLNCHDPMLFTHFLAQAVAPVMSARHTDISLHVFVNIKTIVFSSASYSCCYLVFIYSMKVRFYITQTSGSFAFATEDRSMFCKFKTVCFYLKVISCLLLVRKFSKKKNIYI